MNYMHMYTGDGSCHEKFGLGAKNGPRTVFFCSQKWSWTKLALQNLVHVAKFSLLVS